MFHFCVFHCSTACTTGVRVIPMESRRDISDGSRWFWQSASVSHARKRATIVPENSDIDDVCVPCIIHPKMLLSCRFVDEENFPYENAELASLIDRC